MSDTQTPTSQPETPVVETPTTETPKETTPEGGTRVDTPPTPQEPTPAPVPPKVEEPKKPETDWKQKFSNSSRRNQIVEAQLKELQKTLGDITKEDIPTDDEMRAMDPDWDYRSDFEKNLAVKVEAGQRMNRRLHVQVKTIVDESDRATAIALLCENDPRLAGKEDDFFRFASKNENRNVPTDILVNAFLFEAKDDAPETPATPETPAPSQPTVETPPTLERGNPTGGRAPSTPSSTGDFTPEQLKELRTKNQKEYMRMIRQGIIK